MDSDKKYTIVGKVFEGLEITKLIVEKPDGKHVQATIDKVKELTKNHHINNARLVKDYTDGSVLLDIRGGYSGLKTYSPLYPAKTEPTIELKARLFKEGKCIGYKVVTDKGQVCMVSLEKIWERAYEGDVKGVKAEFLNDTKVLHGDIIEGLPKYSK
jgi:hypothetical protein